MGKAIPLPASQQDREWIAGIRGGDPIAFERAFRAYYPQLCAYAYGRVRSRETAEEVVQDVFTRLWEERHRFRIRHSLKNYLYTAVRNHAISLLRHRLVERRWEDAATRDAPDAHSVNEGERHVESEALTRAVREVVDGLPERCRLALMLRWQRQLSYAEVAEVMGISVKTVEIHIGRGLAALRESCRSLEPYL